MRPLILLSPYSRPNTGAQVRFDRLALYFAEKGLHILWISPVRTGFESFRNVLFLDTGALDGKRVVSMWMSLSIVRNALRFFGMRRLKPLLVSFGETNLIPGAIASVLSGAETSLGIRSNIVRCFAINGSQGEERASGYPRWVLFCAIAVWGLIYRRSGQVTVQTPQAKFDAISNFGIREDRIAIIENDLPVERMAGYKADCSVRVPRHALFIGDDSSVKGFDVITEAIDGIRDWAPGIDELTVVGVSPSMLREFELRAISFGLSVNGVSRTSELPSLMAACHLLIVPSREDQFPNVVLEALAIGLPVIGSDVDGIRHILRDPALLFEPGSASGLLETLGRISTEAGYTYARHVLKSRADEFRFDWEERYFDLLPGLGRHE